MSSINTSEELKKEVIKYMNRNGDFEEGLALMRKTGYKPNVCALLLKRGESFQSRAKLRNELGGYLRYFKNPTSAAHDDIDDEKLKNEESEDDKYEKMRAEQRGIKEAPDEIKRLWNEFDDLYVSRSKSHNEMKKLGERNSADVCALRKQLKVSIEAMSDKMSSIYAKIESYNKTGVVPAMDDDEVKKEDVDADHDNSDDIQEQKAEEKTKNEGKKEVKFESGEISEEEKNLVLDSVVFPETARDLYKMKLNYACRLTKNKNNLIYQSDVKQDKENPMPVGAKRAKKESYVRRLEFGLGIINEKLNEL